MTFTILPLHFVFWILLLTPSNSSNLLQENEEQNFSPRHCNTEMLQTYIKNPILVDSELPTTDIIKICPNLGETCCASSEIQILHSEVITKYDEIKKFAERLKTLLTRVLHTPSENFERLKLLAEEKKCLWGKDKTLDVAYQVIWKRGFEISNRIDASIAHFTKISSGFICSLCERENGFNFSKKHHGIFLIFINNHCHKINLIKIFFCKLIKL